MSGILRRTLRLAVLGAIAAWIADRWLRDRGMGAPPASISTSIRIAAPIERVWEVIADIEGQPAWMHDLGSVHLTTPPPVGVGTRGVGLVQAFGIRVSDPIEVTAFEAPVHFAIRHDGMVKGSGDIRLAVAANGWTIVTWEETLVPPVLPHLGAVLIAMVFRPIFQRDLERLAGLAEGI